MPELGVLGVLRLGLGVLERSQPSTPPPAQWSHTWGVGLFGQNFLLLFFCFYNVPYICEG